MARRTFPCIAMMILFAGCTPEPVGPKIQISSTAALAQQSANKQIVMDFYDIALNQKNFEGARQYFGPYYKQHNPMAADGTEGFHAYLNYLKANFPDAHFDIKRAFAQGDYVILHIHMTPKPGDRGSAIVDIFRLENGKVVEHWDVIQEIPEKSANPNTMF